MPDVINGMVWTLDTVAGLVSNNPVYIDKIRVSFTTAGVGSCVLTTANSADRILDVVTTAASSAAVWDTTREYSFGRQAYAGLRKLALVNVRVIEVVTCGPK